MNRDLLKDAIADAKAVKETAIANAKIALEEAFTPHLKEMFAQKLEELDEDYDTDPVEENDYDDVSKDVSLDELLSELEEEKEEENEDINLEEILSEIEDDEDEDSDEDENDAEEESIEDMSEEDLKSFIEDIIKDMIDNGGEEAGEEEMEEEPSEKEEEEEVSIDELLAEMELEEEELYEYAETSPEDMLSSICNDYPEHQACKNFKPMGEAKKMKDEKMEEAKKDEELEEAYNAIESIKSELEEVKLLNAKLLYTNKLFKSQNLTESQKVKVLNAFDKTTTVKEAKLVYETLSANVVKNTKKSVTEGFKGGLASKATSSRLISESKNPIVEVDSQFARWQKLAGIK